MSYAETKKEWWELPDPVENERLRDAVRRIVLTTKGWDNQKDAVFRLVKGDAGLLWEMFIAYRANAVQALLTDISAGVRFAPVGVVPQSQDKVAPMLPRGPVRAPTYRPPEPAVQRERALAQINLRSSMAAKSLLDTFRLDGRAIGDMTPQAARAWAGERKRDVAFVERLTANLPADRLIREFRSGEETQRIWDEANSVEPDTLLS